MTTITIIGAGYAGVLAANRATARGHQVTLVNERPDFVDRIRLHEFIAGTRPRGRVARPLTDMVQRSVRLEIGRAASYATGVTELADGRTVRSDHVVIATGSSPEGAPGSLAWATTARNQLATLPDGATVVVLGAGLTGIEVATEIAAARGGVHVVLADPTPPGSDLDPNGARVLTASLARLGVKVHSQAPTMADLVIDCTGFDHDRLNGAAALQVDDQLRVPGMQRVWGAGDAVRVSGQPHLRMGCAAAEPMAAQVIDQIGRCDRNEALRPLSLGYAARCISLGRRDGLIQFVERDDHPRHQVWHGRRAATAKELICRFALAAPVRWAGIYRELDGPQHG